MAYSIRESSLLLLQTLMNKVPTMDEEALVDMQGYMKGILARTDHSESETAVALDIKETGEKESESTYETAGIFEMPSIEYMPEEILVEVMTYLNSPDRKNARLVCKQWHRLSYEKKLIKNDRTYIKASEYLNHTTTNSRHLNVETDNLMGTMPFWEKHGGEVEDIYFDCIKEDDEALPNLLRCCPNVKRINMSLRASDASCTNPSFPVVSLLHLERLDAECSSLQTWIDLVQTPKLKELAADIPESPQARNKVLEFIDRHSSTLEGLDLWLSANAEEYFTQIVDSVGAQLTRISLVDCQISLTDSSLHAIVRKFVNLKDLSLDNSQISYTAVEHAISSLKSLSKLKIKTVCLRHASHSIFLAIDNWANLITLDLTKTSVAAESLVVAFRSPHQQLENLYLDADGLEDENYDFLNQICPNFPNLLCLGLHDFHLQDEHVKVIAQHNTRLKDLSLCGSDVWLCSSINEMTSLVHLSLAYCSLCIGTVRALSLPKLHSIDLSCTETTSDDICHLMERNSSLHRITVLNDEELHPIFHDILTDEIQNVLQRRMHNGSC